MKHTLPLLLATALTAPVIAQDIETIEISAVRTPTAIENLASPVTVITSDDLEAAQIYKVTDALKSLPGVAIASAGSAGGQQQLRLRGSEANHTLILIDGIEVNDPAAGDEVLFEHLTATEIERIEVVRGPMSASWGSDALAGVISIVTKRGKGAPTVGGYLEYGAFDTKRGGANVSAGAETWHFSAGISHSDSDGSNASRDGDEADGYRNTTANVKAGLSLANGAEIVVTARHTDSMNEFDGVSWLTGLPSDSDHITHGSNTNLGATYTGSLLDGFIDTRLKATYLDTEIRNLAFGADDGTTGAERFGLYADASINFAEGQTLTLAIDREETDFMQAGMLQPWGDPNQTQEQTVTGYTADYIGVFDGGFSLNASIRRDDNSTFEDATSWRLGTAWSGENTRVFANVSKGQKAPTFIERFGFFSDQFAGNPNVKPETSTSYELGIDQSFGDAKLSLSFFRARLQDEIDGFAFDPVTFLFTAKNKDGKSKRDGFEVSFASPLGETASLSASYTFVNAKEEDFTGTYVQELRRPRHHANIQANWQASDKLNVNANLAYTGKAEDLFFPPWPLPSERVTLKSYILASFAANYQLTDKVTAYSRVENALSEDYEDIFGFETPGAAAYAGLRFKF